MREIRHKCYLFNLVSILMLLYLLFVICFFPDVSYVKRRGLTPDAWFALISEPVPGEDALHEANLVFGMLSISLLLGALDALWDLYKAAAADRRIFKRACLIGLAAGVGILVLAENLRVTPVFLYLLPFGCMAAVVLFLSLRILRRPGQSEAP